MLAALRLRMVGIKNIPARLDFQARMLTLQANKPITRMWCLDLDYTVLMPRKPA